VDPDKKGAYLIISSALLPEIGGLVSLALSIGYWLGTALAISLIIASVYRFAPD